MTKLPIRKTTRLTGYDFNNVELDEYIIMPNHIHGIINIVMAADLPPLQYKNNDQLQQQRTIKICRGGPMCPPEKRQ